MSKPTTPTDPFGPDVPQWKLEPKAPKYSTFPLISMFERADFHRARELMDDDLIYAEQQSEVEAARRSIKVELGEIAARNNIARGEGFRYGQTVVYYNGMVTRQTLDVGLLVENGVPADVIERSKKESKEFLDLRVVDLSKRKGKD